MQEHTRETPLVVEGAETHELRLLNVLYALETQMRQQGSLRFAFLRGVVYGFGTVIGATILIALAGGILASTYASLAELPIVGQWFLHNNFNQLPGGH
jgi:hypothetical protein